MKSHFHAFAESLDLIDISSALPSELGMLSHLTALYVFSSDVEGFIPTEIGRLSKLRKFVISSLYGNLLWE
jgi:hypothetical protein